MKKILFFILLTLLISPLCVFAQAKTYTPLINDLPGTTGTGPVNLTAYLGGLYKLLIGVTIALAFIVITFEGLKHMGSESPFAKSEASRRIGEAVGGIILAVMSWLILYTINPSLVSFKFLQTVENAANNIPPQVSIESLNNNDGLINLETLVNQDNIGKFCYKTALGLSCFDTPAQCKTKQSETAAAFPTSTVSLCFELTK